MQVHAVPPSMAGPDRGALRVRGVPGCVYHRCGSLALARVGLKVRVF